MICVTFNETNLIDTLCISVYFRKFNIIFIIIFSLNKTSFLLFVFIAYELQLETENQGKVSVRHLDVWGSICTNGFDDDDARVICREKGFQGGFAYYRHQFDSGNRQNLPWLSYLNCTGSEGYLARCGNIRWGDVRDCSSDTTAAVYCHDNPGVYRLWCYSSVQILYHLFYYS